MSGQIICNASPLIALAQIDKLWLLETLFQRIVVPPAVIREISPTVPSIPPWIEQKAITQPIGPRILATSLGAGEREAISLALELETRWLILDERPARRFAQALGLPVIGTLGLLLGAKQRQLLDQIKPLLDRLAQHDFRLSTALYERILLDAGELPSDPVE